MGGTQEISVKKQNEINTFKETQNISLFFDLLKKYNKEPIISMKIIEAINEGIMITNYSNFNVETKNNIIIIEEMIYGNNELNRDLLRKLIIILLCYEKNNNNCEKVLKRIIDMKKERELLKKIIFDILLDYSKEFGNDIHFKDIEIYKEFVIYSLEIGKYLESLNYKSFDIIQLKILYEHIDIIFESLIKVEYSYLNDYNEAFDVINKLIDYQKEKRKKLIFFADVFWKGYYHYYLNNEDDNNIIDKLDDINKLLFSYTDLDKNDIEYKNIVFSSIHEIIEKELNNIDNIKVQLDLILKIDPYNLDDSYENKRNPKLFKKINLYDLKNENDIKYFKELNIEKIYVNKFNEFIQIIIGNINTIEDFDFTIKLININIEKNRYEYIELLIEKYKAFTELTEESFILFLKKVIEYSPDKKINLLEIFLPKFNQNKNIYIKLLDIFFEDNEIKEKIIDLSYINLNVEALIDLIENMKESQLKEYFDNIKQGIISYELFLEINDSKNIKLLSELMKKNLIPKEENYYLNENKNILNIIYNKLITFEESKDIYLNIIFNENNKFIFLQRFELFKLNISEDKFSSAEIEYNKIKQKFFETSKDIEKAYQISNLLDIYYNKTLKNILEIINIIYDDYMKNQKLVNIWIKEDEFIKNFIREYDNKANLIKIIKEIDLFKVIYEIKAKGNETSKFDEAKKILEDFKYLFYDMDKVGEINVLSKWYNLFTNDKEMIDELKKLKDYYEIEKNIDLYEIARNIMIYNKDIRYNSDINSILYFFKCFEAKETELSQYLNQKKSEFDEKKINFEKLVDINNFFEEKKFYLNNGKEDSLLIKLIRILFNKENEIKYAKTKNINSVEVLLYRLEPGTDLLKYENIIEFKKCVEFIKNLDYDLTDINLIDNLRKSLNEEDKNNQLYYLQNSFENYFKNFKKIKLLDSNIENNLYENVKFILNNSKFKISFFKKEFKIYDDNNKEIHIMTKDFDGLIKLKNNIIFNMNSDYQFSEEIKIIINNKKRKTELFFQYIKKLQKINEYFSLLENKGCPFILDISITISKDKISYQFLNKYIIYDDLILKLKDYCKIIDEYKLILYKENGYFRYVYGKHMYKLIKRTINKNKNIHSYIRYFTNGDSFNDDIPLYIPSFNDLSTAYKNYKIYIKEKFDFISKYIENIFKINGTSFELLYNNIKIKDEYYMKGIYKCFLQQKNIEFFIVKIFLKLTGKNPIAQNILLTNEETTNDEIYSFIYRAFKCKYNTLFIISITDDISIQKINSICLLIKQITNELKSENKYIIPCILFLIQNQNKLGSIINLPEIKMLYEYLKGDENSLEYNLISGNDIYKYVKVITSDCCGLGKTELIKKKIKENKEIYHYFSIGDNINKDELYKKLKKFLKVEIKGKYNIGIHLDLFYSKNINLIRYFLFSILITKIFKTNDDILYFPNNINIYIEIPNGNYQFLDEFPLLKIFKKINISLNNQEPLNITNENLYKKLLWFDSEIKDKNKNIIFLRKNDTYIEKKNYMNILSYLGSINVEDRNLYYEKAKNIANYYNKCRNEEDGLNIQYEIPLIFKTKNGYKEINISDKEIKGKNTDYFLCNLKEILSKENISNILGEYIIMEYNYKIISLILFKIFSNIPVILIGEIGCGKTELINVIIKCFKKNCNNCIIKKVNSETKESELIEIIENAENTLDSTSEEFIFVFFDELNKISLPSKIKEIFVNHSLNGKHIDERIRFFGACNFNKNKEVNLPNSMLSYIIYLQSLDNEELLEYIENIIDKDFPKGDDDESENSFLRKTVIESIYQSHKFIKKYNNICSVSLRDIQRFKLIYHFFINNYYKYKNEFLANKGEIISDIKTKIKSFILSLFISYCTKIEESDNYAYLEIINVYIENLIEKLDIKDWLYSISLRNQLFSNIIKEEQEFLLIEMGINKMKEICICAPLKNNIFLMFVSIYSHIPLIAVGNPGFSKSLSINLIINIMKDNFNESNFMKKFPKIKSIYFQCSQINTLESIKNTFKDVKNNLVSIKSEENIISLLIFDNLDLIERNKLHYLENIYSEFDKNVNFSLIGINNKKFDEEIMDKYIYLKVSDILLVDIFLIIETIGKTYGDYIYRKYSTVFKLLGKIYYKYKKNSARDLYNLVKIFYHEIIKFNNPDDPNIINSIMEKALIRNLSEIDINGDNDLKELNFENIKIFDLIKENILAENNCRFLLLVSEKALFGTLINIITKDIDNYVLYIGSPFKEDILDISYQVEMINNIEKSYSEGKLIILSDLNQIYQIFFHLFDQNYIYKDSEKYFQISYGNYIQKLVKVNENSRFVILIDKNDFQNQEISLLSRFEKYIISFDYLLNDDDKEKSHIINNLLKKLVNIKDINYNLDNILVNINEDIISGYVYLYKNKENNSYKNIIKEKIIPLLPQDIIISLPLSELNKEKEEIIELSNNIDSFNRYDSLEKYLNDNKNDKENILIIYTFSKTGDIIYLTDKESHLVKIMRNINNIYKFKEMLKDFYEDEKYKSFILKLESEDAKYINFFIFELNKYQKINNVKNENKKFIFIINIKREFNKENKNNKVTTILIKDETMNQLFIDNINGAELLINEIKNKNINDYLNYDFLNLEKIIINQLEEFYRENISEKIGKNKGIDNNNFIKEFTNFIENSENCKDIINNIKKIILSQINNNINIIDFIIKNNYINENTIDFITEVINIIKHFLKEKIKILLKNSENNNFFTTMIMLNIKDIDKEILENEIIIIIQKEFLKLLKFSKEDRIINIKLNYKIPGFYNIYKEIFEFIEQTKISKLYFEDESEIRKCENEFASKAILKLNNDIKEFNEKLYLEIKSKKIINEFINMKKIDKNYEDFIKLFLDDYISFYIENIYDNNYVLKICHNQIVLSLLDFQFEKLNVKENYKSNVINLINKILWLEANSYYIKKILDVYNIISDNIFYDEKDKNILNKNIINYIQKNEIKYEPKEPKMEIVNKAFYKILLIIFKCTLNETGIKIAALKNDNYSSYFKYLNEFMNVMKTIDESMKLGIIELDILDEYISIYNSSQNVNNVNKLNNHKLIMNLKKSLEIIEKKGENKIELLYDNLKILTEALKEKVKNKEDKDYNNHEPILRVLLSECKREKDNKYRLNILNEFVLKDKKLLIKSNQLLKIILEDFVSTDVGLFQNSLVNLSKPDLNFLEEKLDDDLVQETLLNFFEFISIIYIQNLKEIESHKKENKINILIYLKSFFENCLNILEYSNNVKINLKQIFSISFIRIYLHLYIDYIDQKKFKKDRELGEIIEIINNMENNEFKNTIIYFICKIIFNKNNKDINEFFKKEVINRYHLYRFSNFDLFKQELNSNKSASETSQISINELNENLSKDKIIDIINEDDRVKNYDKKEFCYYKYFLYSDYPDINFFRNKLNEAEEEISDYTNDIYKYPLLNIYLNENGISNDFLNVNFVINSLLCQYSSKIFRDQAKQITFEQTDVYKVYTKICDNFIRIINKKNNNYKLTKESILESFLIDENSEFGKIYKELYIEYTQIQNNLLKKVRFLNSNKIDIQKARKENLLILESESKNYILELILMNSFRDIYTTSSEIKYQNYNSFSINFDNVEKILEENLVKNICFLKTDSIEEMKYKEEDFLNDGISYFNNNLKTENLDEQDKKRLINFYMKKLNDLKSCVEINENIINIIKYVNKNYKKINISESIYEIIIKENFNFKINDQLKNFLSGNQNLIISKLTNLLVYLENLYFEIAMRDKKEYREKIGEEIKNKLEDYYVNKKDVIITKDKLSENIIRFLLNIEIAKNNSQYFFIDLKDNIFDYLGHKFLWNNNIINNPIFSQEVQKYKELEISIKSAYDLYYNISKENKRNFEKEIRELKEKIKIEEKLLEENINKEENEIDLDFDDF